MLEEVDDRGGSPFPAQCHSTVKSAVLAVPQPYAAPLSTTPPPLSTALLVKRPKGTPERRENTGRLSAIYPPPRCRFEIVEEFLPLPEAECRHVLEYVHTLALVRAWVRAE